MSLVFFFKGICPFHLSFKYIGIKLFISCTTNFSLSTEWFPSLYKHAVIMIYYWEGGEKHSLLPHILLRLSSHSPTIFIMVIGTWYAVSYYVLIIHSIWVFTPTLKFHLSICNDQSLLFILLIIQQHLTYFPHTFPHHPLPDCPSFLSGQLHFPFPTSQPESPGFSPQSHLFLWMYIRYPGAFHLLLKSEVSCTQAILYYFIMANTLGNIYVF